ncbi:uncharacterized protein L201_004207 [Kwoniella dendrophila CBS 6074]|uniref:Uncharacterized protein n=1 Tax=Kwoniella dendrophila CBS 6074 TaxID=1295534 RepID=A0AAX4JVK1_9TREE
MSFANNGEAGPSRIPINDGSSLSVDRNGEEEEEEMVEIPSTGLEFFEYRRRLFLAGLPLPSQPQSSRHSINCGLKLIPEKYIIPLNPPKPLPSPPMSETTSSAVQKLEIILRDEGSEELKETWENGIERVAKSLHQGRKLAKGLRLGLVIKILKASWIQDGLWPKDEFGRPAKPPNSPLIPGVELFPDGENIRQEIVAEEQMQMDT